MAKKRILSGVRPTGPLHIGHYFGALQNWIALQEEFDAFFMVADWHALTDHYRESGDLRKYGRENVADWIACGLDPAKSTIFVQSEVPEHAELHLILSCITPLGWLQRVPTYKAAMQERKAEDVDSYAFLGYPVLQTADILLYKGDCVPVGEDQLPHLELAREITRRFNGTFGQVFPEPQARLTKTPLLVGPDGRKMSKSYGNAIVLGDPPEVNRKKILAMITDPARKKRTDLGHPDVCNVYSWHKLFSKEARVPEIHRDCSSAALGCVDCKGELADRIEEFLKPIRERRRELDAKPKELDEILAAGNAKARKIAQATMAEVRQAIFKSK